jgi:hypothetical protein
MIGEKLGMQCYGIVGDSPLFVKLNYFIREYFAVVKQFKIVFWEALCLRVLITYSLEMKNAFCCSIGCG